MDSSNILADIAHPLENRIDPMLHRVQERVRELELELAQTKLAHVEAECRNQVDMHTVYNFNYFLELNLQNYEINTCYRI